jgi:hypothetical protein
VVVSLSPAVTLSLVAILCASALSPVVIWWQEESASPGDRFGVAIALVGDVTGDDVDDVLVGAPRAGVPGTLTGRVSLRSGVDGAEWFSLEGAGPLDAFGTAVAGAGDLDGDGVPDLIIGSPAGTPPSGSVHVVSGAGGGLLLLLEGNVVGDRFGEAVAGVGDVDGDGVPDLAVGAPQADDLGHNGGRASVHAGQGGHERFALEGAAFDHVGTAVAGAGDVDGDGHADVLVGAPLADGRAFNGGSAYLLSGRDGVELVAHHGAGVGDQFGHWLAGVGDVDGDGTPDLAFGIPGADAGALDAGAVEVRSGATGELLLFVAGLEEGGGLGVVASAGDVDRDGYVDLAVGAPTAAGHAGRVRVLSGATGQELLRQEGLRPWEWFGASLAGGSDLDGDGHPDLLAGAPGHDDVLEKAGLVRALTP